jgi:hypothetical protein
MQTMQVVVYLLVGALLLLALQQGWARTAPACPLRHSSCNAQSLLHVTTQTSNLAVPLSYQQGVYEVDLWVGGHPIRAVLDTGSERLIVAGDKCVHNSRCTGAGGIYHVNAGATHLDTSTIAYGTQKDHVHWFEETLGLPTVPMVDPCSLNWGRVATQKVEIPLEVGVVQEREGDTNLNVMGFCPPLQHSSKRTLLHALLGDRPVFGLLLEDDRGWLILGSGLSRCLPLQTVPLVRFRNYKYLMVRVHGVNIVDDRTGERRSCAHAPQYAILDSGSNMLSVSTPLLREMNLRCSRTTQIMELDLGHGCVQTYHPAEYCLQRQLLVRDNLPLAQAHQAEVMLIGSLFLRQRYIEFDLEQRVVRLGKLRAPRSSTPMPQTRIKKNM